MKIQRHQQILHQVARGLGAIVAMVIVPISPAMAGLRVTHSPIVRPSGNVPQMPVCYGSMPNQGERNLDAICLMGQPKVKPGIDMLTDQDQDGVPDALAAEFRKLMAAMNPGNGIGSNIGEYQRRVGQALRDMNERMPYSEATKASMREMAKLLGNDLGGPVRGGANSGGNRMNALERMEQLNKQMRQDPMFNKVQEYSDRYNQQEYEKSRPRR
jgi:hypothetical protein